MRTGRSIAKPNYSVGPRVIEHYSIHFVLEGEMIFQQPKCKKHVKKWDMYCIFPNLPHRYYIANSKKTLRFLWISIQGRQVEALLHRLGVTSEQPHLPHVLNVSLLSILERISESIDHPKQIDDLLIVQQLYNLFQELMKHNQGSTYNHEHELIINKGLKYMDMHFDEGILVQDVVHHLRHIERSQFTKLFRRYKGMSPKQYLQNLRMKKGERMLRETSFKVTEIALSLGYPDLYSFTRAFKQYFGLPPTTYRERIPLPEVE